MEEIRGNEGGRGVASVEEGDEVAGSENQENQENLPNNASHDYKTFQFDSGLAVHCTEMEKLALGLATEPFT